MRMCRLCAPWFAVMSSTAADSLALASSISMPPILPWSISCEAPCADSWASTGEWCAGMAASNTVTTNRAPNRIPPFAASCTKGLRADIVIAPHFILRSSAGNDCSGFQYECLGPTGQKDRSGCRKLMGGVNMFVIPAGRMFGAQLSVAQWWLWNQLPVTLGNIVSGALLTGLALYWTHAPATPPAFDSRIEAEEAAPVNVLRDLANAGS